MSAHQFPINDIFTAHPGLAKVFAALNANNGEVRIVGGLVRDFVRGVPLDGLDFDLATTHEPDVTTGLLEGAGIKTVPVGIEFGTVIAIAGHEKFEITSLRSDIETNGRHATVEFTTDWRKDAARRDLTINAMSVSADGAIHDYEGGLADLHSKRLRLIGVPIDRLHEDYLRLLRVFRFASKLGADFTIDDDTLAACSAAQAGLTQLSGERVLMEFQKLLVGPNALAVVRELDKRAIFQTLFGRSALLDVYEALCRTEQAGDIDPDPARALIALFGAVEAAQILSSLNAPNVMRGRAHAAGLLLRPGALRDPKIVLRRIWKDGVEAAIDAALISGQANLIADIHSLAQQSFPVQGRDVLALGVKPGPDVGKLLARLEDWWFDEGLPGREETLRHLNQLRDQG